MGVVKNGIVRRGKGILLREMGFTNGGGNINWFPGHIAFATKAIRNRLKISDLVIEVRDARIPLSSANQDLHPMLAGKRRVIALKKKDLANPNIMPIAQRPSIYVLDTPGVLVPSIADKETG